MTLANLSTNHEAIPAVGLAYSTPFGSMYQGAVEDFLSSDWGKQLTGNVQLLLRLLLFL